MTFEDDTTCCKMHKLGVFPFFVTIGDILQHKLYSVITIGVMLQINLKLVLVLVLRCNLPSQIVTPLVKVLNLRTYGFEMKGNTHGLPGSIDSLVVIQGKPSMSSYFWFRK